MKRHMFALHFSGSGVDRAGRRWKGAGGEAILTGKGTPHVKTAMCQVQPI